MTEIESTIDIGNARSELKINEQTGIEWGSYGTVLDIQADLTPDYWENIEVLLDHLKTRYQPDQSFSLCDIGAGTGNCTRAISKHFVNASITHLEPDPNMNKIANAKLTSHRAKNVKIVQKMFQEFSWAENKFDVIVSINSLYTIPPQSVTLSLIRKSLADDGTFYVVDFGRKQKALDWFWYFVSNALKGRNIFKTLKALGYTKQMIQHAARGTASQSTGDYWTHSTEEFGSALTEVGFKVFRLESCYREYADRAICTKN